MTAAQPARPIPERRRGDWLFEAAFAAAGAIVGRRFLSALREMREAQWLSCEELRARTDARLARLLEHAAVNVPFYREACARLGLSPRSLRTVEDLRSLPVLTKTDYRQHSPEVFCAANVPAYLRLERATSGSTGEPLAFALDRRALPVIFASHLFYDSWFGFRPFTRYVRIVAPPATPPVIAGAPVLFRWRQSLGARLQRLYESWTQEKLMLWEVDAGKALEIRRRIEAFRPEFLMGYTSTLALIADELLKHGERFSRPLRGVVTIAETLSPPRRRLIEEYFRAPVINRYGLREFGSWSAQSCPVSPERFHVNTELVVCEVLREDGTPAAPGETGRVVLTDLWNYARPFIRYDTGDLAAAGGGWCECGRGFPLLGEIEGRSLECLRTPSGKTISPAVLGHFLFVYNSHLEHVRHYQLVQEAPDRVCLVVVPADGWNERAELRVKEDLSRFLGDGMHVGIRTAAEIPAEESGKRPIIKPLRPVRA